MKTVPAWDHIFKVDTLLHSVVPALVGAVLSRTQWHNASLNVEIEWHRALRMRTAVNIILSMVSLRHSSCVHSLVLYVRVLVTILYDRLWEQSSYGSVFALLHSIVPTLVVLCDRVRPSILWYELVPVCTLSCCTISIAYGNSTHVYWYCCTPSYLHSSCRTTANAPVCCGTNSHLRALLRDARSRSRAGTVLLVYWYCCTTSRLHSSCCKTNLYLRALLGAVRSRSPWDHVVRMLTLVNSTMYAIRLRSSCVRELVL